MTSSKPLDGIRVLDFTGVQSGPSCTQMLAWFGADVIKIERPGVGDVTRNQLRDIPDVDALYFTMLNSNKRSLELNTKTPEGKAVMEKLIRQSDVLVENFHPGAIDHMGFTWEHIQELNPRLIFGSIKGFNENSPYANVKAYENVAQSAGGSASTTGFPDGPPTVSAAALGDSNTGMHLLIGILTALLHREKTGKGQRVTMSMQDAVLNLCRVKLRDQQRLEKLGFLEEYPQYPNGTFGDAVPRGGNASGGGQPGTMLKCKGSDTDPNAYIYFINQDHNWENTCDAIGRPEWKTDPAFATTQARASHIQDVWDAIEEIAKDKDKHALTDYFDQFDVPCSAVLSMKEIMEDPSLRRSGSIVEVQQPKRGTYLTVGCPMKFSAFMPEIKSAPLLGEHNNEVLKELGYSDEQIMEMRKNNVI
ncbi:formyl-CoA transferase [Providencia hangzhouensis]|uniref:formyl-CoA transferase n=1 Tax=Providencia TaxID=586 RepID=UPI00111CEF5B|nr:MULTISPECIES: formyl-CoA transferase [Providencia]MBJ9972684.1 formyl-CoA transferase [Providencia rettgeri]MCF8963750.1 Formyl-CoA:oxalate CoA-transferase [Providencia rettgeri]MDB9566363.1 formyl-CoA transferase [Providencia rettgeri]TNU99265.1 formyl-CoA transferase [Providencia rettgeri]UDQ67339.1 formyl-CoA transferase [Providencia rettgeri]